MFCPPFLSTLGLKAQNIAQLSKSDLVKWNFNVLASKRKLLANKDVAISKSYQNLLHDADGLLSYNPVSVMQKKICHQVAISMII